MRLVIVGGGISGLTTALIAAQHGHEVTVVDRDVDPPDGGPDELATWERRGVPHAHFAHFFQGLASVVLRRSAPALLDELTAAGTLWRDLDLGPETEGGGTIAARRAVFEGTLRRHVLGRADIDLRTATKVTGVVTDVGSPTIRVSGVELEGGERLTGDLVIDAGGRRSGSDRWLEAAGASRLPVEDHPVRVRYLSRHYRLRDGATYPDVDVPFVVPLSYANFFVFHGDNDTFSVGAALPASDPLAHALLDGDTFDRVLAALPSMAPWLERTDPISPMYVMAGLSNRRRRCVVDGGPVAAGFATVGDAAIYTNPTRGQGIGLSTWMADHLVGLLDRAPDPVSATVEQERSVDEFLADRFHAQVRGDDAKDLQLEAGARGQGWLGQATHPDDAFANAAWAVAATNPDVAWRVTRVSHMLDPTRALREHEPTRRAIEQRLAEGLPSAPPTDELSRHDFERLVTV